MIVICAKIKKNAQLVDMELTQESLEDYVGGTIKITPIYIKGRKTDNVVISCKDAKQDSGNLNRRMPYMHGLNYVFYGNIIVCRRIPDGEGFSFADVEEEYLKTIFDCFNEQLEPTTAKKQAFVNG